MVTEPFEREPDEVPVIVERPEERGQRGSVGQQVDRVGVRHPSAAGPVGHQVRRHPDRAALEPPAQELAGQRRLAGAGGADELDDHPGAPLPTRGATSR